MSAKQMKLGFLGMAGAGLLLAGFLLAAGPLPAAAQAEPPAAPAPGKTRDPYFILSGEFFEAMQRMSKAGERTYGDRQEPLLEQIAVATQYVVKTNLTLIKQNDRIIQLLEELNRKRPIQEKQVND
jgi:ABC-type sugar transport system substrate-binding protein